MGKSLAVDRLHRAVKVDQRTSKPFLSSLFLSELTVPGGKAADLSEEEVEVEGR